MKTIADWIQGHLDGERLVGNWFEAGGSWRSGRAPGTKVETAAAAPDLETRVWTSWAVRFEHPDSEFGGRIWRTDLGIEIPAGSNEFFLAVTNSHFLRPGYIGQSPPPPLASAPKLVRTFLEARFWVAHVGSEWLGLNPILFGAGDAPLLAERLAAGDRCPIVVVSQLSAGTYPVDVHHLARKVAGAASLYAFRDRAIEEELDWFLPDGFRCYRGSVRVYQPGVLFGAAPDARRHRFIKPGAMSASAIEESIIRGVCQLPSAHGLRAVRSLEDVFQRDRDLKLAELKAKADYGSREWIQLLEQDNEALAAKVKALEDLNLEREELSESRLRDLDDTQHELARLKYEKQEILIQAKARDERTEVLLSEVSELPSTLEDTAALAERAFSDRLAFTERARRSARDATFSKLPIAWRCLRVMATELWSLHFNQALPLPEIALQFRQRTGFELATGESESTRNDPRLARMRKVIYKGERLDISTHVKYGVAAPNCLRIHYHPHQGERRLIIGHCGDHLDTISTN